MMLSVSIGRLIDRSMQLHYDFTGNERRTPCRTLAPCHLMAERIFVSYSHHDAALVTPVVRLLRSTNDFVFQDTDSIKPGVKWRGALADAIREANLVVIFWCLHANQSSEVQNEYLAAIQAAKQILPVLLDSTPVPPALEEFQWVDFRELVQHGRPESVVPAPSAPSFQRRSSWLTAAAGFAVVVVALSVWMLSGGQPADVPGDEIREPPLVQPAEPLPSDTPPVPVPPPVQPQRVRPNYVPVMVVCLLVLTLVVVLRSLRTASRSSDSDLPLPGDAQVAMATNLAREIHLRLTPDRISTD